MIKMKIFFEYTESVYRGDKYKFTVNIESLILLTTCIIQVLKKITLLCLL